MDIQIHGDAYGIANLVLNYDEKAYVAHGSIAVLSDGIDVRGSFGGDGVVSAFKRHVLGGESLLFTEVHAQIDGVFVSVAPPYPGGVQAVRVNPSNPLFVESGSLLAYAEGVSGNARVDGLRTMLLHEGITLLELSGEGLAAISGCGTIEHVDLEEGQSLIVDTGHLVGFSSSMIYDVGPLGSVAKSITTGEGLVARLTGPGEIFTQTRAPQDLQNWLFPDHPQNGPER